MAQTEESRPIGGSVRIAADRVIIREGGFFTELLRMSAKIIVGGLMIILLFSLLGLMSEGLDTETGQSVVLAGEPTSQNDILLVRVDGPILNHAAPGSSTFFPLSDIFSYGYDIKEVLTDAAEDDAVKSVLLFLSTPGGQIAGSQAIHDGVRAVQEAGKPVVAYIDGLSASGGVWAMSGADEIYADHGSVIGSVGVLGPMFVEYVEPVAVGGVFDGVETRGGVVRHSVTAGRGKDLGDPFRSPTDEEQGRLQDMVDEFYVAFLEHLEASRGLSSDLLRDDLGAALFSNEEATRHGFIDGTLNYDDSILRAADAAGLGEDYRLVSWPQSSSGPFIFRIASQITGQAQSHAQAAKAELIGAACSTLRAEALVMPAIYRAQLCGR